MLTPRKLALFALFSAPLWCACRSSTAKSVSAEARAPAPMDATEMWAAYVRLATPTQHHRALEPMAGRFKATTKSWMDPDSEAEETRGTMVNRWILGARFLQGELKSQMNGMPFEGIQTLGFDNAKQRYVATWIDNMGTNIMPVMEGTADKSGKVITIAGTLEDPVRLKSMSVREVWTIKSQDEHDFEMWTKDETGQEFKVLEIVYTRM